MTPEEIVEDQIMREGAINSLNNMLYNDVLCH